jgi:hypothetical protein
MDLAGLGTLISALTGLLVAGGTVYLQRQRRTAVDAEEMEDELEVRTKQYQLAMRHIRRLEDDRANHTDLPPIRRPAELRPGYFETVQARGRHGRRERDADLYAPEGGQAEGPEVPTE